MRVRRFGLRLISLVLTVAWSVTAALVLVGYRPGGPVDLLVGAVTLLPVGVALTGLGWPPIARGDRAYAAIVWLGLAAALVLIPSIVGIVTQLSARGPQTLLPSLEAAYPWLLALVATSLFSGLGLARWRLGDAALRRPRLLTGVAFALTMTAFIGSLFATVAIANEVALRDRPAVASRFGPTDPALQPPACNGPVTVGPAARLELDMSGTVDGRPLGSVQIQGTRVGTDAVWQASLATATTIGSRGVARVGDRAWQLASDGEWATTGPSRAGGADLDSVVLASALTPAYRATYEMRGIEFLEGARARHCRIAIDGLTFLAAFPSTTFLIGATDIHRWRGQLDYWVFGDGQLGQVSGAINGDAASLEPEPGIQATITVLLTATDRDQPLVVKPPVP